MKRWQAPKYKSEMKSFLQTCQFCSRYMRGAPEETNSDITKPLRELMGPGVIFKWTKDCNRSFKRLMKMLLSDCW